MTRVKIILIDDDAEVRHSTKTYLETLGWDIVEYSSASEFLHTGNLNQTGCILLDLTMPGIDGLQLQDLLKKRECSLPIIFISGTGTIDKAVKAMSQGAVTFLEKPVDPAVLREFIIKAIAQSLDVQSVDSEIRSLKKAYSTLTQREKEIVDLIIKGVLNKHIAEKLNISLNTVKTHRSSIFAKLGVKTAIELTRLMVKIDGELS